MIGQISDVSWFSYEIYTVVWSKAVKNEVLNKRVSWTFYFGFDLLLEGSKNLYFQNK